MLSIYCKFYALNYHLENILRPLKYKELDIIKCIGNQCDTGISGIQGVNSEFTHAIINISKAIRPLGGLDTKVRYKQTYY